MDGDARRHAPVADGAPGVMPVLPEDRALLEWTRRRMLARACWVAAATTLGPSAAAAVVTGGAASPLWLAFFAGGAVVGLGAFRAARRAYAFDVDRLVVDRLLRRRDPAWRVDPEGGGPAGLFTAQGPGPRIVATREAEGDVWRADGGRELRRSREPLPSLFRPLAADVLDRQAADLAALLAPPA